MRSAPQFERSGKQKGPETSHVQYVSRSERLLKVTGANQTGLKRLGVSEQVSKLETGEGRLKLLSEFYKNE